MSARLRLIPFFCIPGTVTRAFVAFVQAMLQPVANGTIVFESHPEYFDSDVLRYASSAALRRTDIDAKLVSPR
jgi:hypothetical protein